MASRPADKSRASKVEGEPPAALANRDAQQLIDTAFDEFDVADLLESHSELVMNLTETIERLERALETRGTIGQALGICIERYDISAEQAFTFLTRISQDHNVKLRDVAARLVERTVMHEDS
jgi:AmiR/NasT family two-component response regulator